MMFKNTKTAKITYRICSIALALFILPGLFLMNSEAAVEGMAHMGLTDAIWLQQLVGYGSSLAILLILIPQLPNRLREWAYVGLGMIYLGAVWGHITIDGLTNPISYAPLVTFGVLLLSYLAWHSMLSAKGETL